MPDSERVTSNRIEWRARAARTIAVLLCLTLIASGIGLAWSAEQLPSALVQDGDEETAEPAAQTQQEELTRATPRGTIASFLEAARAEDWEEAAAHLDYSAVARRRHARGTGELTEERRTELAQQLLVVLERHVRLDLAAFSGAAEGEPDDHSGINIERIGTVEREDGQEFDILLARVADPGGGGPIWVFSESTVVSVPTLFSHRGYGWIEELLPESFFDLRFLTIELWQWVGLLLLVVASSIVAWIFAALAFWILRLVLRAKEGELRTAFLVAVAGPMRFALAIALFCVGATLLHLPPLAWDFIAAAAEVLYILCVAWFLLRCVDIADSIVSKRLERRDPAAAYTLVPMGRRVTKVFIVVLALISLVQNLGFSVTGLLTTLGVGGLAIALAAQKPLENLFGAITVISDRPVKVGDFCRVGEHIGHVEDIGLRSTRLRTLSRTVVAIPNGEFANARIENYTKRDRIWLRSVLQFGYDTTPDQMRYLLVEIRRMLYAHPKTDPDPCRVRFLAFNAYSLDVEVFVYILTTDFSTFLAIQEDINLRIMDIVATSGAYFAYPSQTLYLGRDQGKDEERSREAEERVRAWRDENQMPLPDFPPDEIRALDDTLAFPDRGSSSPTNGPPPPPPSAGNSPQVRPRRR